jgi:phospholipid/cholesterol/gamma-HCH transport system ATP-binding protein
VEKAMRSGDPIIDVQDLRVRLRKKWVLDGLNLSIYPGEIVAIVGGSGEGKSTLLRSLIRLQPFKSGSIHILGQDITTLSKAAKIQLQQRWGMLFQQSALFGSMTVMDNVLFPMQKHTNLDNAFMRELALLKIMMTGLEPEAAIKYPAELSGGMQKRAALARALALDPNILFLDEPTAGLDPQSAAGLDDLVLNLRASLKLTIVIVTHDLDTLWHVPDKVAFLDQGKLIALDKIEHLVKHPAPAIQAYFKGPRARLAQQSAQSIQGHDSGR